MAVETEAPVLYQLVDEAKDQVERILEAVTDNVTDFDDRVLGRLRRAHHAAATELGTTAPLRELAAAVEEVLAWREPSEEDLDAGPYQPLCPACNSFDSECVCTNGRLTYEGGRGEVVARRCSRCGHEWRPVPLR